MFSFKLFEKLSNNYAFPCKTCYFGYILDYIFCFNKSTYAYCVSFWWKITLILTTTLSFSVRWILEHMSIETNKMQRLSEMVQRTIGIVMHVFSMKRLCEFWVGVRIMKDETLSLHAGMLDWTNSHDLNVNAFDASKIKIPYGFVIRSFA